MTNEAISAILEHLCNEARNSAHATFGALELMREGTPPVPSAERWTPESGTVETAGWDRMLQFIDDIRELTSASASEPQRPEEFDLVVMAAGILDALNLASCRNARHMILSPGSDSLIITQDRAGVEEVLTRVLNAAFKQTRTSQVQVRVTADRESSGAWAVIAARDADLARKLILWLSADAAHVVFADPEDVPLGVAMMVAGKRLRFLGGSAELERDAAGHLSVALHVPTQAANQDRPARQQRDAASDALSVMVVEDCDESFVLSEVALQDERITRARDGQEALDKIHKQRFDLVLMDIHMPGLTGYEVIRNIRDWETETGNARTPIVILSSDDLETQRRSAAQCGCSGFLRKPLGRPELATLLDRVKQSRVLVG